MPSSGAPAPPRLPMEDAYLELLADTLEGLDLTARGQFLQRYFRAITHLDLLEDQCIQLWDEMTTRRRELNEHLDRPVSLKTALMDVLSAAGLFRVPIIIEYDELKKLQLNAVTDPLTGLYNRRLFSEYFDKELNRARRYGSPLGLVILDMHRFKEVNDQHGHPRGDEVLRIAADTLKKALRTSDSAFRIGGDEFALLLPETDAIQSLGLSRRVETVFADNLKALNLSVPVSIDHGIANYPQDGDQADQLIRVADERLYRLKHANHGRTGEHPPRAESSTTRSVATISMESAAPQPSSAPEPEPLAEQLEIPPAPAPEIENPESSAADAPPKNPETPVDAAAQEPATPASAEPPPATGFSSEASPAPPENSGDAADDAATGIAGSSLPAFSHTARMFTIQRQAERVSMTGTNAYAVLGEQGARRARVIDLGFGGVALEMEPGEDVSESILAVLHVPILPPVRVTLKPVWSQRSAIGAMRIGCAFVS